MKKSYGTGYTNAVVSKVGGGPPLWGMKLIPGRGARELIFSFFVSKRGNYTGMYFGSMLLVVLQ